MNSSLLRSVRPRVDCDPAPIAQPDGDVKMQALTNEQDIRRMREVAGDGPTFGPRTGRCPNCGAIVMDTRATFCEQCIMHTMSLIMPDGVTADDIPAILELATANAKAVEDGRVFPPDPTEDEIKDLIKMVSQIKITRVDWMECPCCTPEWIGWYCYTCMHQW